MAAAAQEAGGSLARGRRRVELTDRVGQTHRLVVCPAMAPGEPLEGQTSDSFRPRSAVSPLGGDMPVRLPKAVESSAGDSANRGCRTMMDMKASSRGVTIRVP